MTTRDQGGKRAHSHDAPSRDLRSARPGVRETARAARPLIRLVLVSALAATLVASPASAGTPDDSMVRLIGLLELPPDANPENQPAIIQIDVQRRRLFLVYGSDETGTFHLADYDLAPRLPALRRSADLGPDFVLRAGSEYRFAVDARRNRLLSLGSANSLEELESPSLSRVEIRDLDTLRVVGSWELQERVPGFVGWGLTYAPKDGLVYVLGEFVESPIGTQHSQTTPNGTKPAPPSAVVALKRDGTLAWVSPLPHCQPLNNPSLGAMVVRASSRPVLYVPCIRTSQYPNMSGITRIWIKPNASQAEALQFTQEFFPISGFWLLSHEVRGTGSFDPGTERVFMQTLSTTNPGAWVFDGRISAWVGFIASPELRTSTGINQGNGHYYMAHSVKPLIVVPARGTPVPQGVNVPGAHSDFRIWADPNSNRLFALVAPESVGLPEGPLAYAVFEDMVPSEIELEPPDYDALTEDVPEGPDTYTSFAGGISGFGLRAAAIGGYGGSLFSTWNSLFPGTAPPRIPGVGPGDRVLTFAHSPSLDLRDVGASASAQAVSPDALTDDEHRARQKEIETVCARAAKTAEDQQLPQVAKEVENRCPTVDPKAKEMAEALAWPWPAVGCLDAGGDDITMQGGGPRGQSEVECDLAGRIARAKVSFQGAMAQGISIGSSSFEAKVFRDQLKGVVTQAIAVSRGVRLEVPDVGSVSIGAVTSTATTRAAGRPGTARVAWHRTFDRLTVRDESGSVIHEVEECTDETCQQVVQAINSAFAPRLRVRLPEPDLQATPQGAFAEVRERDPDALEGLVLNNEDARVVPGLEVTIYNDGSDKSRLVLQFAGIRANSIYTISSAGGLGLPGDGGLGLPTPGFGFGAGSAMSPTQGGFSSGGPSLGGSAPPLQPAAPEGLQGALAFLIRSPKDALHLSVVLALFAAAAATVTRRSALQRMLEESSA